MELKPVYLFIVAFIVVTIGIVTLQVSSSNIEQIDTTNHLGSSNFTYTSPTTLTSEEGIISNSIKVYNESWPNFDGKDDYVNGSLLINISNNWTLSSWVNLQSLNTYGNLIKLINSSGNCNMTLELRGNFTGSSSSDWGARLTGTASDTFLSGNGILPIFGNWYHIVGIYNGTTLITYENGTIYLSDDSIVSCGFVNKIIVGSDIGNTGTIFGGIDEVRIYNRSLSDAEVLQLYNQGRYENDTLLADGLVLYYPFNEGNGTTAYDKSGNLNNGVLTNF